MYTLTIRVGDTSAQDVPLNTGNIDIERYPMSGPDVNQSQLQSLGDGNGLSVPAWGNVTESIDIFIKDTTAALVATKVRAIEKALDLARQGTIGWLDERVYLLIRFDQDSEAWRSQILAAKLELAEPINQIWRNYVQATIIVTRRYFWETETIHSLAMTSGPVGTPTTAYVTVYNADDSHASNQNWFQIDAAQVQGSIPAPLKLYVKNNSGSPRAASAFHFGNYVFANPTGVNPVYRADEAAGSDPSWSSGLEWTTYYWSLSGGGLTGAFKGQFGRILAMFTDKPASDTLLRAALQYREPAPVIDIALGDQVLAGTQPVIDLGSLPIPPNRGWFGMGDFLYLTLKAKSADASGDTLAIDWMQVMPSGAGLYRVVKAIGVGWGIVHGDEMIDDGMLGATYALIGGDPVPGFVPFFEPIHVWPGRTQRIRMIVAGGTTFEPAQPWLVKAETRFRRLTL